MRIYNLTDRPIPKQKGAGPTVLRKAGIIIQPGGYADVPDTFRLGAISGWVNRGLVSIGERPDWYLKAREKEMENKARARSNARKSKEPRSEPKSKSSSKKGKDKKEKK